MHTPFQQLISDLSLEIGDMSSDALEAHPENDSLRWNTRQIVEHLVLTYRLSGANLQDRLNKGSPSKYQAIPAQISAKFALLKLGYFPPGRGAPMAVMPSTEPAEILDGVGLSALFAQELLAVGGILNRCRERFGRTPFATYQILGPLNAAQWQKFHVLHARHHLKQIRKLVKARSSGTS